MQLTYNNTGGKHMSYRVLQHPDISTDFTSLDEANEFAQANAPSIVFEGDLPMHGFASEDEHQPARMVHAYPLQNILRPANSMQPYSLSQVFYEIANELAETWLDNKFADAVSLPEFLAQLKENAHDEIDIAINQLMEDF
jgi:hypothetical protein